MRLTSRCVPLVTTILIAVAWLADAQTLPGVFPRPTPQRTTDQAPPVPTVMRPAAGEVVIGDLVVAVQVPPSVPAREYTVEAAYWDPERNNWVYPGTLVDHFTGGTTATTRIAADMRMKWNQKASRWQIHARVTQPPGSWGPWREFTWQSAPPVTSRTTPTPVDTPTNTANPGAGEAGKPPTGEAGKPGMMVPGTTTPPPGTTTPPPGQPTTGTPPTAPPSTNLPAVQQPPAQKIPEPGPPDARKAPTTPNPGPPDMRTAPPTPPSTNVPAVQQPAGTNLPAVQQPTQAALKVPRTLPSIPNLPVRIPRSLPKTRSGGSGAPQPSANRPAEQPGRPQRRLLSATRLAGWDGKPMPASNQRVYVPGPIDVDWARKSLQWWFRGVTTAPTASPGKWRWEMSRTPFAAYASWTPISGFGYTGLADGVQFFIDLNAYALRPPGWPATVPASSQPQPTLGAPGGNPVAGGAAPTFSPRPGIPAEFLGTAAGSKDQIVKVPNFAVPVSRSLYVRVVPLDAAGNDADLPSNAVELVFGPAEKPTAFDPNPKYWPVVTFVSYRPVQAYAFDWQCWVEASKDVTAPDFFNVGVDPGTSDGTTVLFKKGTIRNTCGDDGGGIVGDFVDAIGGFVDMLGDFVDWASKTYANLKAEVASKLVSVIPGCSSDPVCAGAVQMGLNAGMAALGMPPDLPDFDQLQAMGEGYLVDAIAQQVAAKTPLWFADEAAKAALKEFIAKGKEAALGGGGGGASPWIPDETKQYKPLLLTLNVSNPSPTGATPPMYLEVSEPGGARYNTRTVAVPSLAPGQSVKVAVSLEPVKDPKAWMELLPTKQELGQFMTKAGEITKKSDAAKAALNGWRAQYLSGVVNLQAALNQPPFVYKAAYQTACFADKQGCLVQ